MKRISLNTRGYLAGIGIVLFLILVLYHDQNSNLSDPSKDETIAWTHNPQRVRSFEFLEQSENPEYRDFTAIPWAVTYSPLTEEGHCIPKQDITNDLNDIIDAGIKAVRFFSVDCAVLDAYDDLEYKGEELEIILGLHPYPAMDNEEQEEANLSHYIKSINLQLAEISMWNRWDRIAMLVVGSQGVHHERYSRSELVRMIRYVRLHLESEQGFRGLITTVEPVQSWASPTKYNAASIAEYKEFQQRTAPWQKPIEGIDDHNSEDDDFDISNIEDNDLCAVVDLVSLTIQPYFNSGLYPDESGRLIERDVKFVKYLCSDDFIGRAHREEEDANLQRGNSPPVAILETGWPKAGRHNGNAVPGRNNQILAINSMLTAYDSHKGTRIPVTLHSYQDEVWLDESPMAVEKSFGVRHLYT